MAYLPLSTANLPDPAIDPAKGSSPEDHFSADIWSGNSASSSGDSTVGQVISSGFQPDWIWTKERNNSGNHKLFDTVRGLTKQLSSDGTGAEETRTGDDIVAVSASGYTLGTNTGLNYNGRTYVGWSWKAGGTGVSNTDGSITSTVSANTTSGFSIVSWTGNGTAGATIGHGLGAVPSFIIVKNRGTSGTENRAWTIYHSALGATKYIEFSNSAEDTGTNRWNDTAPTSSVFTVGDGSNGNENGDSHIAYCFADVEGFSKFGSYQGGSDPFVYLGFEPAMIMFKRTTGTATHWAIRDNARKTDNPNRNTLYPSKIDTEYTGTAHDIDFLSNGFKIRNDDGLFDASATYIYAAWAKTPFKYGTGV
tara:strand:- start:51 stop:1142 length:1092 start_codon:yes stop_codon:yes gene_type:complete